MTVIRRGGPADLAQVATIQQASPGAADWNPADYPSYDFRVAIRDSEVVGFLVSRAITTDEWEILNLAVAPEWRRRGVARDLLMDLMTNLEGAVFLEVRESNVAARNTYKSMGFKEVGRRPEYYQIPLEAGIVMKFHSC